MIWEYIDTARRFIHSFFGDTVSTPPKRKKKRKRRRMQKRRKKKAKRRKTSSVNVKSVSCVACNKGCHKLPPIAFVCDENLSVIISFLSPKCAAHAEVASRLFLGLSVETALDFSLLVRPSRPWIQTWLVDTYWKMRGTISGSQLLGFLRKVASVAEKQGQNLLSAGGNSSFMCRVDETPQNVDLRKNGEATSKTNDAVEDNTCKTASEVFSWGYGRVGQLGHGDTSNQLAPCNITALSKKQIMSIAAGESHSLYVSTDGTLYSSGRSFFGQLGLGDLYERLSPNRVQYIPAVTAVSAGEDHSIAVTQQGHVYTWGQGLLGQLGHGDREDCTVPTPVQFPQDIENTSNSTSSCDSIRIVTISAAGWHSMAVSSTGACFTWGRGHKGRLGHGNEENQFSPKQVCTFNKNIFHKTIVGVAAGDYHSLFLTSCGIVYSCGQGDHGQLGHNSRNSEMLPRPILTMNGLKSSSKNSFMIVSMAAGHRHSLALTATGRVLSWGRGLFGRLGHGNQEDKDIPTVIHSLHNISHIACGDFHSLVMDNKGIMYTFGDGGQGGYSVYEAEQQNLEDTEDLEDNEGELIMDLSDSDVSESDNTEVVSSLVIGGLGTGNINDQWIPVPVEL